MTFQLLKQIAEALHSTDANMSLAKLHGNPKLPPDQFKPFTLELNQYFFSLKFLIGKSFR